MVRASERTGGSACRVGGRVAGACAALLLLSAAAWGAERPNQNQAQPWVTISLGSLGVPPISEPFLRAGSSMLTLDLVDDTHVLLTFSSRGLVPRDPSDSPNDESRMVAAELVELPTGKVLARADWKLHDHGRYLWRLGKGRFLLRIKNDLFVLTPEARLKTANPLGLAPFPTRDGMPVSALISPEKTMLTVETVAPKKTERVLSGDDGLIVSDPQPVVMLDFYRLAGGDAPGVPLRLNPAGLVKAPAPIVLPMDGDGYLWPDDGGHGRWPVSFNEFGGREVKITRLDSSCMPRLQMVSRFEFLAFTCKAMESRSKVQSFGMDGHETWEDNLNGTYGIPELAYAPQAGRFALSRIVSSTPDAILGAATPEDATQEMRVYQTESGELLLKVPMTPVTRYAETFDLSEDGLVAAVVTGGAVQVYKLPPPNAQDQKDLEEARSFSPPQSEAPVSFAKLEAPESGSRPTDVAAAGRAPGGATGSGGGAQPAAAPATAGAAKREDVSAAVPSGSGGGAAAGKAAPAADSAGAMARPATAVGDPAQAADAGSGDGVRRKPPTLLEPGETVEKAKPPNTAQQQQR